ncbi:MAG: hypothetical protein FWC16_12250 [Defluviitaleaceae bacterium]|nr:hypothetical protein [Defluviitaleaceae bacterium]MCL2275691.1 hypothetical protein [Defluviitaleaceae bacterium]
MIIQWNKNENKQQKRGGITAQLFEAHNKAQQAQQNQRRNNKPRVGTVRLSNTDTLRTALAMRRRVMAKLAEVAAVTDVEPRTRDAMLATVKMQIDKIDRQITAIRRRERAVEEERRARRDECRQERRRRQRDMQENSVRIRRDMLYPAGEGGFNPHHPLGLPSSPAPMPNIAGLGAAVSFDVGGVAGTMGDASGGAPAMDVVL